MSIVPAVVVSGGSLGRGERGGREETRGECERREERIMGDGGGGG